MTKTEMKARVDYRMKPLLAPGVRVKRGTSTFAITEYDFFDSTGMYVIHVSDRVDPFEVSLEYMPAWLDALVRLDGLHIPKFYQDDSLPATPQKQAKNTAPPPPKQAASQPSGLLTAAINAHIDEALPPSPEVRASPAVAPAKAGAFVHIESTNKIYVTRDYSLFGLIHGNRALNKEKIKRIVAEIEAGTNLLQHCPIVVVVDGNKLKVVDGQHRLEVSKQLKTYVYYTIISDAVTLYQIAKLNSNTEKWAGKDFINAYAQMGNKHYVTVKEFTAAYGFPLSTTLSLLASGTIGDNGKHLENFRQGIFVVKHYEEAVELASRVGYFKAFPSYKSRPFVQAIAKIAAAGKVPVIEVAKAFESNPTKLTQQPTYKDYITELERIVNIGKGNRRYLL